MQKEMTKENMLGFIEVIEIEKPSHEQLLKFVRHWLSNNEITGINYDDVTVSRIALGKLIHKTDNSLIMNGILIQRIDTLEKENARLHKALKDLVTSEVIRTAEYITYSEAYLNALSILNTEGDGSGK